ncbi:MAG: hypothetical protein EPN47_00085 [Acidobacteria bacterium]|nr:MAG: hypothetical protein EPN47_00085 [Acidobacteriota bacterium]
MNFSRKMAFLCALCLGVAASAAAQLGQNGPQTPKIPTPFTPVVGSGAQYEVTTRDGSMAFTYAVVGKEQVEGNDGYWLEIRSEGTMLNGEMVIKELTLKVGTHPEIKRMIMQPPGRAPMEVPAGMIDMMKQHMARNGNAQRNGMGEKIGTENITVPAGAFECDHYRRKENGRDVDYWISSKVSPYSLVKMSGPDTSMVLEKVLTGVTTHVKGEPQKMQMPDY